jgi:hypothetical protein
MPAEPTIETVFERRGPASRAGEQVSMTDGSERVFRRSRGTTTIVAGACKSFAVRTVGSQCSRMTNQPAFFHRSHRMFIASDTISTSTDRSVRRFSLLNRIDSFHSRVGLVTTQIECEKQFDSASFYPAAHAIQFSRVGGLYRVRGEEHHDSQFRWIIYTCRLPTPGDAQPTNFIFGDSNDRPRRFARVRRKDCGEPPRRLLRQSRKRDEEIERLIPLIHRLFTAKCSAFDCR